MKRIFVNGTFDILHVAHIELLNYAREMGDYLMVAIDSDKRVTELKGPLRPINTEYERYSKPFQVYSFMNLYNVT